MAIKFEQAFIGGREPEMAMFVNQSIGYDIASGVFFLYTFSLILAIDLEEWR
ncbi:MAG: hypothetical protein AAFV80_17065 [Bacteroidota bacterium]